MIQGGLNFKGPDHEEQAVPSYTFWPRNHANGDLSIELESDKYDFDEIFTTTEEWGILNKKNLLAALYLCPNRLSEKTNLIRRMNVGLGAMSFSNLKDAFYMFRSTDDLAFKDMMAFYFQIKDFYGDLKAKQYPIDQAIKIRSIQETIQVLDKYYVNPGIMDDFLKTAILSKQTQLDSFFRRKAHVTDGSYHLSSKDPGQPYLFDLLMTIHQKMANAYQKITPFQEQMRTVGKEFEKELSL